MNGFSWSTVAEVCVALSVFAVLRRLAGAMWNAFLKSVLRRSQRLRLTVAASLASDKELGRWIAREEDELEVAR